MALAAVNMATEARKKTDGSSSFESHNSTNPNENNIIATRRRPSAIKKTPGLGGQGFLISDLAQWAYFMRIIFLVSVKLLAINL